MEFCEQIREEIKNKGFAVVPFESGPFSQSDIDTLKSELDPRKVTYSLCVEGDTQESHFVNYIRLAHDSFPERRIPGAWEVIEQPNIKSFFCEITGNSDYRIERCQCHVYGQGSFVSNHVDADYYDGWSHTMILLLQPAASGGELILTDRNFQKHKFSPNKGDLVLFDTKIPHEVLPVNSGTRQSFVFFIKDL